MSEEELNDHAIDVAIAFKNKMAGPADATTNGDVIVRLYDMLARVNKERDSARAELTVSKAKEWPAKFYERLALSENLVTALDVERKQLKEQLERLKEKYNTISRVTCTYQDDTATLRARLSAYEKELAAKESTRDQLSLSLNRALKEKFRMEKANEVLASFAFRCSSAIEGRYACGGAVCDLCISLEKEGRVLFPLMPKDIGHKITEASAQVIRAALASVEKAAPEKSQVLVNAEKDQTYAPYCLRCRSMERMAKIAEFYWRCSCGAEHDERKPEVKPAEKSCRHEFVSGTKCVDCRRIVSEREARDAIYYEPAPNFPPALPEPGSYAEFLALSDEQKMKLVGPKPGEKEGEGAK